MALLRLTDPIASGKDVHDHHFSKTAKPLTAEEAARVKELGFNNPVGTTHHTEGFIRYNAVKCN